MTLVETLKHIGSCGFTVAWSFGDDPRAAPERRGVFVVNFKAYEVGSDECQTGDGPIDTRPRYVRDDSVDNSIENMTLDLAEAEVYAHGSIKWDGCSTISFGDDMHMCGHGSWQAHVDLMAHLWRRAGEIMGKSVDDGEFQNLTLDNL